MINKKEYWQHYKEKNKSKLKQYHDKYNKEYYEIHKEKIKKMSRDYETNNKPSKTLYRKEYYLKNKDLFKKRNDELKILFPEKIKARNKARQIKIPKGYLCDFCNKNIAIEKHHEDYNKPLELFFLCGKCHKREHHLKILTFSEIKQIIKDLGTHELWELERKINKEFVKRGFKDSNKIREDIF